LSNDIYNKKKKKPLTKAAVAKKMIKKQIKPNQKTVFDETGEVSGYKILVLYIIFCKLIFFRLFLTNLK